MSPIDASKKENEQRALNALYGNDRSKDHTKTIKDPKLKVGDTPQLAPATLNLIQYGFVTYQMFCGHRWTHFGHYGTNLGEKVCNGHPKSIQITIFLPQWAPAILNLIRFGFVTRQNVLWALMDTFWAL
jgi:hypothetical protein